LPFSPTIYKYSPDQCRPLSVSRSFNVTPDPPIAGYDLTVFNVSHIGGTL